jgi:hypothetical protein
MGKRNTKKMRGGNITCTYSNNRFTVSFDESELDNLNHIKEICKSIKGQSKKPLDILTIDMKKNATSKKRSPIKISKRNGFPLEEDTLDDTGFNRLIENRREAENEWYAEMKERNVK